MSLAPIALFTYNRPDHTERAIGALLRNPEASSSALYVFSDGPKREAERRAVDEVRAYVRGLRGFASVDLIERDQNLGAAASFMRGVPYLTERFGRIIVVEDDLVVSPFFLRFMNDALDRYASSDEVMQVSGFQYPVAFPDDVESLFLPFTTSWGWATWARSWRYFDAGAVDFDKLKADRDARFRFNLHGVIDYVDMMEQALAGKIDAWDIHWYFSVFKRNGLVLYPARSLVGNFGFDGSGTHCGVQPDMEWMPAATRPITRFPSEVSVSPFFERIIASLRPPPPSLHARVRTFAGKLARRGFAVWRRWALS
jgi:hypothetical protein